MENKVMENKVTIKNSPTKKEVIIEFDDSKTTITTDKITGEVKTKDEGDAPPSQEADLGDLELKYIRKSEYGGKISGILSSPCEEVIFFTNSPGCYWYWNGRKWKWR